MLLLVLTFTIYVIVCKAIALLDLFLIFNMKKFISSLLLLVCSLAQAEYTAENKIIKVVIPQPPASGLGSLYRHVEAYANKQNIKMIPVFKQLKLNNNCKIIVGYDNVKNPIVKFIVRSYSIENVNVETWEKTLLDIIYALYTNMDEDFKSNTIKDSIKKILNAKEE